MNKVTIKNYYITCTNYLLDATSNFEGGDVFSGDCQPDPTWTPPILGGRQG